MLTIVFFSTQPDLGNDSEIHAISEGLHLTGKQNHQQHLFSRFKCIDIFLVHDAVAMSDELQNHPETLVWRTWWGRVKHSCIAAIMRARVVIPKLKGSKLMSMVILYGHVCWRRVLKADDSNIIAYYTFLQPPLRSSSLLLPPSPL